MKKAKPNQIVSYIETQTKEPQEALDIAFSILFEEVMKDRKEKGKVSNLDKMVSIQM